MSTPYHRLKNNLRIRMNLPLLMVVTLVTLTFLLNIGSLRALASIVILGVPVTEDFNTLALSGTSSTVPGDWAFSESGTNANTIYTAGTGSSNTGDTYSFGATGNFERAFGGLQSGSLIPTIGSSFTNNTGQIITSLDIAYTGEQWRLGTLAREDRLDFQYSLNATSLTTGIWTDVNSLDFIAPTTTGATGLLDGNAAANRVNVSASIIGLSIPDGSTFWIRWTDFNASGADDGLAVDNFSLTANGISADAAPSVTSTTPANSDTNVAINADITINFSEDVTLDASWYTVSCGTSGSHTAVVSGGPQNWIINPDVDFANSETCTVTIDDASVHDVDANDPPDTMAADYVFSFTTAAAPTGDVIHISQVYGGGGNSGATYTHDFIELFNAGTTTINLTGWSVQYGTAAGTVWSGKTDLSGSIVPGQYYLVQQAAGAGGTTPLPSPDVIGTISMAAGAGKVALVNSTTPLPSGCTNAAMVDLVGYGTNVCYEGATAAPALTNTTAGFRQNNGCQDTDQNGDDFFTASPAPRNTQSPFYNCTTGDFSPAVSSTAPANGATNIALNADITINFSEGVTLDGGWYAVSCATSGSHTAAVTGGPQNWTLNPDVDFASNEICTVTLTASAVHDIDANDPPDTMAANYVFSFTTVGGVFGTCFDNTETLIHTIQGVGLTSPVAGSTPVIEGIVTADYQNSPTEMGGFFIQEEDADADANPATSEGIYVFESAQAVAVGDVVRLQGTVVEFTSGGITFTEISPVATLTVCSGGNSLPAAAAISLPAASVNDLEAYEGMRVTLAQTLYVTEHFTLGRFGEVLLSANDIQYQFTHGNLPSVAGYAAYQNDFARSTITLDDANAQQNKDPIVHPAPGLTALNTLRIGDTVAGLTGILDHRFDLYRIQPTGVVPFTASNPRPAAPENVGGTIWVGSFNVLNYFSTIDPNTGGSGYICGPLANQECRGADSAFEFTRQRDKIIQAIIALNADVIGLMEIENHLTDAALDDLINGLNAVAGAGTYAKISQFPLGDDAIKVALIYRPAWVTPVNPPMIDNNAIFDRPPLAQLFEVNNTGERFTVVVNHFKSKGCGGATGADADQADGQGCYNDRRTQQSTQLLSFINTVIVPGTGDSDVLIIGDLNAYALENPITALTGAGMTNLLSSYLGTDTFSYIFDGQAGYLDHALVSGSMVSQVTGVTHWGINGDEPISLDYNDNFKTPGQVVSLYNADPYRSSDHSPVRIGLYPNDFGDLVAGYGNAWHTGGGALRLGTAWTADRTFGVNTDNATDDGIVRLSGAWTAGATATLRATVTRTAGANPAWLSCWMDWDGNGAFATPSERAINTAVVVGVNDIPLTVPLSATSLTALSARCRLYDSPTETFGPLVADPAGAGTGGEVEDYNWGFSPTAITLQEIKVAGNAAAPILLSVALIFLVLGSAWGWRRREQ